MRNKFEEYKTFVKMEKTELEVLREDGRYIFKGKIVENKETRIKDAIVIKQISGYVLEDKKEDKIKYMEKKEAIEQIRKHGVINVRIKTTETRLEYREEIDPVKGIRYMSMSPLNTFKDDEFGREIHPLEVNVDMEKCTKIFKRYIKKQKKEKRKPKGYERTCVGNRDNSIKQQGYNKEGRYTIVRILCDRSVYDEMRKMVMGKCCGYIIEDRKKEKTKYMEKYEAVEKVKTDGLTNGYIAGGGIMKEYLQQKNIRGGIDRTPLNVFEVDEKGTEKQPLKTAINMKKSTEKMKYYIGERKRGR